MIIEKPIYEVKLEGDFVRSTTSTGFYRDGKLVGKEEVSNRLIAPGDDVTAEAKKIRRVALALHVPTMIAAHRAGQEYEKAIEARGEAEGNKAQADNRLSESERELAETQAELDVDAENKQLQARLEKAKQKRAKSVADQKKADDELLKADKAEREAKRRRDEKRKEQDDFEKAEDE